MSLLRSCADPGLPNFAVEASKALVNAECNAIVEYCKHNSDIPSSIFHELVVSEEVVPGGAFIIVIRDILVELRSKVVNSELDSAQMNGAISSCLATLSGCKDSVFSALRTHTTNELNEWEDPRPTVAEAWLLAMNELIKICCEVGYQDDQVLKQLGCETLTLCIQILSLKLVDKEKQFPGQVECLSLDGPQTLAMVEFFELVFKFGHSIFSEVALLLHSQMQLDALGNGENDPLLVGGGVIAASIYRCASGGVPPWAIEYVPSVFKSLFHACGDEMEPFLAILHAGSELKLQETCSYGCIRPGKKLAGHYYDTMKPKAKEDFMDKAREICKCNDNTKWRKLKVLVKAVCGKSCSSQSSSILQIDFNSQTLVSIDL